MQEVSITLEISHVFGDPKVELTGACDNRVTLECFFLKVMDMAEKKFEGIKVNENRHPDDPNEVLMIIKFKNEEKKSLFIQELQKLKDTEKKQL